MTAGERRSAARQLAVMLRGLHGVRCPADLPGHRCRSSAARRPGPTRRSNRCSWPSTVPVSMPLRRPRALCGEPARHRGGHRRRPSSRSTRPTLVHGDLHFENVLWDGTAPSPPCSTSSGAAPGPPTSTSTSSCGSAPTRTSTWPRTTSTSPAPRTTPPVPYWLAEDYPELFGHPHLLDRITALLDRLRRARAAHCSRPPKPPTQLSTAPSREPARPHGAGHQPPRPAGRRDRPRAPVGLRSEAGPPLARH